jgi:hypothetical protein
MGECFLYANLDRREFFRIDALGGATKASGIGRNCGARALGLLLTARARDRAPSTHEGAWAGHRVAAIGDELADGGALDPTWIGRSPHLAIEEAFRDVASTVAVMLITHDGPDELVEVAARDDRVLVLLGEIALVHRIVSVAHALRARLGEDWPKRYAVARRTSKLIVAPP